MLAGAIISEGSIIQAESVVVSEIPNHVIAEGDPAKVFKYRDIDHYNKLKFRRKIFLMDVWIMIKKLLSPVFGIQFLIFLLKA